jgi:hypothetical protein
LEAGFYTPADQKRWPVSDSADKAIGDHAIIGSVTVTP